jgi:hypothetical protein
VLVGFAARSTVVFRFVDDVSSLFIRQRPAALLWLSSGIRIVDAIDYDRHQKAK